MKGRIVLAALVLMFPLAVFAQNAAVGGTVADASGALIPGVEVTVTNINTGIVTTRLTNETGAYNFASVQPGSYVLSANLPGFQTQKFEGVQLGQGQQIRMNFTLQVAAVGESVEVTTDTNPSLALTSASVGNTLPDSEIRSLPLAVRDITALIQTMAGTSGQNFGGQSAGDVNTTRDGLTVGEVRFLRQWGVVGGTFVSPDLVEEIQVVTTSVDAASGRGSGQVRLQTRSGTNDFHGALFYTNNNSALNAQNWFDNLRGAQKSYLNRTQYGGRLGGPIIKNKAFFFVLIDNQRYLDKQSFIAPVLTEQARQGIFRYINGAANANALSATPSVDLAGNVLNPAALRSFNLFSDVQDPFRSGFSKSAYWTRVLAAMPKANDFTVGDGLNTAGFRWNRPRKGVGGNNAAGNDVIRDQINLRFDYKFNDANTLFSTYSREHDKSNLPQNWPGFTDGETAYYPNVLTFGWTWTISPTVLNEFRLGRKSSSFYSWDAATIGCCKVDTHLDMTDEARKIYDGFDKSNGFPIYPSSSLLPNNIMSRNQNILRGNVNPRLQISDTVNWTQGKHSFNTGFEVVRNRSDGWNTTAFQFPTATIGNGSVPVGGITSTRFPGLQASDATTAASVLNELAGSVGQLTQGFFVNKAGQTTWDDWSSPDARQRRDIRFNDWSAFFKDTWNATHNLTLNFGLRYDMYGSLYEANGMTPRLKGGQAGLFGISGKDSSALWNPFATGGDLTIIELAGTNSPNASTPFWPNDRNNFAPSFGFSYSLSGLGRPTVVRGGYGINYSGAVTILDYESAFYRMPGSITTESPTPAGYLDLAGIVTSGVFPLKPSAVPFAPIPLTSDRTQNIHANADNRVVPYIQSFNLSVQRELAGGLTLDVAYVGNKATKLSDIVELNEPNIFETGILDAFNTTVAGGDAPLFNRILMNLDVPNVGRVNGTTLTGSQAFRRSALTRSFFANGSVAAFASFLNSSNAITGVPGGLLRNGLLPENFIVVNPQFGSAKLWASNRNSSYHSMQIQLRKRMARGFSGQFSYTLSKALGDGVTAIGEGTTTLTTMPSIDPRNRSRNKGRLSYDQRHAFNVHATWELPFGPGHALLSGGPSWLHRIVEGWQLATIGKYASGAPLTLTSTVKSLGNTSNLNVADLVGSFDGSAGQVSVGNGFVEYLPGISTQANTSTAAFGSDPDGLVRFITNRDVLDGSGNVILRNPVAGKAGNLGVGTLEGPGRLGLDMSLSKLVRISETKTFTFRADAVNFLNTPQWGDPNTNINSTSFGRITTATGARTVTIGARVDF